MRIKDLTVIQKSAKPSRRMDLIAILLNFLIMKNDKEERGPCDVASKILSMLIVDTGYSKCEQNANDFLNRIYSYKNSNLSAHAYTASMMNLLKINELAISYTEFQGINTLQGILLTDALDDYQIAYNTLCCLWIMSYHPECMKQFEIPENELIENVLKVLDFFNKEKVVRMTLLLLSTLKKSHGCLEIMSDLNTLELIEKLQQRHWVDEDIVDMLDKLWEILDENYQEFSSLEKWKKEISSKILRKGPVHTERFWQENFIYFNEKDNLDMITNLIDLLKTGNDRTKAVALFDLGEFAKYYPHGRYHLNKKEAKPIIYDIMQKSQNSEVKKEAITCL